MNVKGKKCDANCISFVLIYELVREILNYIGTVEASTKEFFFFFMS